MYYELYADSLWVLNFVLNLCLLTLVDKSLLRTATRRRLVLGAALGACTFLLPFCWGAPAWIKYPAGVTAGTTAMILTAFAPKSVRMFVRVLEKFILYSFLGGGLLLFFAGTIPFLRENVMSVRGTLALGAMGFLALSRLLERRGRAHAESVCRAVLARNGVRISVNALVDSGNSLVEPVSGKPVAVIGEEIFVRLWPDRQEAFRAVPYCSVGRKRGILRGYLLPELKIEVDGIEKSYRDVYVAVGGEYAGEEKMILNPALLKDRGSERKQKYKLEKRDSE